MQAAKKLGHSAQLIALMQYCIEQKVIGRTCGNVFIAIAKNWNPKGLINPSRETLCRRTGLKDVRSITNHTKKLSKLNLISFFQPKSQEWFGQQCNKSNHYSFDYEALRQLFFTAKKKAKLASERAEHKAALAEASTAKNIPPKNEKNVPPISSLLRNSQSRSIIATERCDSLKDIIFNAYQHLCEHGEELKRISGLKNWSRHQGIKRTPKQEQAYQALQKAAAKVKPEADAKHAEINALKSDLTMWEKLPERFNRTKRNRLLELVGGLSGMDKLRLERFDLSAIN